MDDLEFENEQELLNALQRRNIKAFMRLYKNYGEDLLIFAYAHLQDRQLAIKAVDEFFEDLWAEARFTKISPPIYKYLVCQILTICEQKNTRA